MIAFPSVEVQAEYSVYSGSSLSAPASGPTYTLYRNGTALTLGGGGTTGWTGVSISTVTITTGLYIARFTPPALSSGVLSVGDVLALRVDTGSTGVEWIGSWAVDNTTASRVAAGGEVTLVDGAITAPKIASGALSGKGDWSTYAGGDTAGTTTLLNRITSTRAGYLDNLSGGTIATQADINAINQSASRRIILTTVSQWERPESGSVEYTIEARTYDGDGASVNADSTPTLTVTGSITGSLSANLATATNPATGVYRWQYTVSSSATLEQVRVDISAVISSATFTLSAYSQTTDLVSSTWTSADRTKLTAVYDKLPSRSYLAGSTAATGAVVTADVGLASANLDTQFTDLNTKLGTPSSSVSADIAAVKTDTGNLVTRIPATLFSGITYLARWLGLIAGKTADSGTLAELNATTAGAGYSNTTDSLQALRDQGDSGAWGGSGGSGLTGANLVTLTVTDGTDPVPGARVRVKAGAQTEVKATNASGVVTFSLDNNTWSVRITSPGLTFEATTLSVTGDVTQTYTMTEAATDGDYYATGDDLVAYFDAKTIGMMLLDNGTSVAASSVAAHSSIERFLRLASGAVNSALMASKRYSADDLTGLTGESEELLKQITCDIAMYHIARRRMDVQPERTESLRKIAEGHLERLRKGELILEVDAVKEAGIIDHAVLTQAEMQHGVQLVRHRVGYYPVQQTSRTQ